MVRPGRERLSGFVEVDETYWGTECAYPLRAKACRPPRNSPFHRNLPAPGRRDASIDDEKPSAQQHNSYKVKRSAPCTRAVA
jgi:acyl-coenzyme A synthetase/AMP-(fatty) acid ligase